MSKLTHQVFAKAVITCHQVKHHQVTLVHVTLMTWMHMFSDQAAVEEQVVDEEDELVVDKEEVKVVELVTVKHHLEEVAKQILDLKHYHQKEKVLLF